MRSYSIEDWLIEQDIPMLGGQPDPTAGQAPAANPGGPGDPMGQGPLTQDPQSMQNLKPDQEEEEDVTQDPQFPDMPEQKEEEDFETWKANYIKESIKGDPNTLVDMIMEVRDRELETGDRKFVEDNLQINFLRGDANIYQASQDIRKKIKQELDRNNPANTIVNHIIEVLEGMPMVSETYIKFLGLGGAKGDVHRKFVASLMGAIQVGSGASNEDLVFEEKDYSIRISTRFNARFGDVSIGRWSLFEDDPEKYLKAPELARLEAGSPEEKDVLRRRVVLESIADLFRQRAFIINVVGTDGTIYHMGWDLGGSLKSAYTEGKIVVRTKESENSEAIIDDDGKVLPALDWYFYYVRETGGLDEEGKPETEEIEFMQKRDGILYLTAQLDTLKEASTNLQGMVLKEIPWRGAPTDILRISRCVPSVKEMLGRNC